MKRGDDSKAKNSIKRNGDQPEPQESNLTTWWLAKMNLGIRGVEADHADCIVALRSQTFHLRQIPVCFFKKLLEIASLTV